MVHTTEKQEPRLFTFPFLAVTVLSFLMTTCLQMTVSAMPLFVVELGLSKSLAGSATTACTLAALVMRPFAARMSDRMGELKTAMIGSVLLVLVFIAYFFCRTIPLIMILRMLQGIGISMLSTSLGALATGIIPRSQLTKGMSYYSLGNAVALSMGPAIGLALVDDNQFPRLFGTGVAFAVVMVVLLLAIRRSYSQKSDSSPSDAVSENFWDGMLHCGALAPSGILILLILSQVSLSTFLSFYAAEKGIEGVSVFFTLNVFGMVASKPFLGSLCKRFGNGKVAIASCMLLSAAMLLVASAESILPIQVAGTLYGFGYGGLYTLLNVEAVRKATPQNRGIANSLFFGAKDVGTSVGAIAWGLAATSMGYASMYYCCAAMLILAGILFVAHSRRTSKKAERSVDYADL